MPSSQVIKGIAVTAELCGKTFSPEAAAVFASDLDGYPEQAVLKALTRCRKEVRGLLTVQDVISRIDDGRPGAEEAWAMIPNDDVSSVVWTQEMAAAYGAAEPLLYAGDKVGARMAFKEKYVKLVADARDEKKLPQWTPSFGTDHQGRQLALIEAVRHNRMAIGHAADLLPPDLAEGLLLSVGATNHPLLAAPNAEGKAKIKALMLELKGKVQ